MKRIIAISVSILLILGLVAGCGKSGEELSNDQSASYEDADTDDSGAQVDQDEDDGNTEEPTDEDLPYWIANPEEVEGTISITIDGSDDEDFEVFVEMFNETYPNIEIEFMGYEDELNEFLTTLAASKSQMPDIAYSSDILPYPISQGWVFPLDEYLAEDPEVKYMPESTVENYNFLGKTYALPMNLHFNTMVINLDLLDELNLDPPEYTWTVDQFKEYAQKATTDKYSGINNLFEFDDYMGGQFSDRYAQTSFDPENQRFELVDGTWTKCLNLQKELKAVPGLVSDDLINQELREEGKEDDYDKKFGKDSDAYDEGKVLIGYQGTWDYFWLHNMKFEFDMYPQPQDPSVGYRNAMHIDYAMMLSTTQYPDAAYAFLRWLTYGYEGNMDRLEYYNDRLGNEGDDLELDIFIPISTHPDVVEAFNDNEYIPEGLKYMYMNVDKSFPADFYRTVPGFNEVLWDVIFPKSEEIRQGTIEAPAVAVELQDQANEALEEARAEFEETLKKVQADFPELREQIEE